MPDPVARLNAALEGRYRVERELGQGGMATVYLAEDLKHDRKVALKVLKPELVAVVGGERFLAEIKTTANLQHPHILPLFDSGAADSFLFYVMPYVEGETLRERIDRERQLPVDEAVRIATAVAHALEHAHRHAVIHRDIKPANILLEDGEPVVADFGIALALGVAGGSRLTETGLSLGTPYYMSPEQATGDQVVGPPTDTYALGCVLYEMLVGEPPYVGNTAQAVLGKIITGRPVSVTEHRPSVPANVDAALRCALEKLPADRFPSAQDFVRALHDPGFRHGEDSSGMAGTRLGVWKRSAVAMGALAVAFAGALTWALVRPGLPDPVVRFGVAFPPGQEMVDESTNFTFDIAPDGAWIVYVGPGAENGQLWIKPRNRYEAVPLPGTEGARGPSVSPDGAWIAFTAGGQLRKIPSGGGPAITLVDSVATLAEVPPAWLDDGTLAYLDARQNLSRVPWSGGPLEILLPADSLYSVYSTPLPDSRGLLVGRCDLMCGSTQEIWVFDLQTGEARQLITGALWSEYIAPGYVIYAVADGGLFALPFDPRSLEATGAAVPLLDGVKVDGGAAPDIAVSKDGTLLMIVGPGLAAGSGQESVWVDREGGVTAVDPDWTFMSSRNPGWSISPDGTRLAIGLGSEGNDDIWIKELDDGPLTRLTFHPARDARPAWTLDGRSVMFFSHSRRVDEPVSDLYVKRADGVGPEELLLATEQSMWDVSPSPRGNWLALRAGGTADGTDRDIVGFRPGVDSTTVPLLSAESYDEMAPAISPDGRLLAYVSDESGRQEVYLRPFPDVGSARWPVSTDGGTSPLWAHSGGELFFLTPDSRMVSAVVETSPAVRVAERRVLFGLGPGYGVSGLYTTFDISVDDQRFLMVRGVEARRPGGARMILVQNWFEELKETVGR